MKIQNVVQGLLIFVLLSSLLGGIMTSFGDNYGVTDTYTAEFEGTNSTITGHFLRLSNDINTNIDTTIKGIDGLLAPKNLADILGGLVLVAIGFVKTLWTFMSIPARILNIVVIFYNFPDPIINIITTILLISFAFILLRLYTKEDL